ncbi:MAG: hypothetical protein ACK4PI_00875 [Tepidisphaerales bacterium]
MDLVVFDEHAPPGDAGTFAQSGVRPVRAVGLKGGDAAACRPGRGLLAAASQTLTLRWPPPDDAR